MSKNSSVLLYFYVWNNSRYPLINAYIHLVWETLRLDLWDFLGMVSPERSPTYPSLLKWDSSRLSHRCQRCLLSALHLNFKLFSVMSREHNLLCLVLSALALYCFFWLKSSSILSLFSILKKLIWSGDILSSCGCNSTLWCGKTLPKHLGICFSSVRIPPSSLSPLPFFFFFCIKTLSSQKAPRRLCNPQNKMLCYLHLWHSCSLNKCKFGQGFAVSSKAWSGSLWIRESWVFFFFFFFVPLWI